MKKFFAVCTIVLSPLNLPAQDSAIEEVQQTVNAYVDAFNKADAQELAKLWNENGSFETPSGDVFVGHKELLSSFESYFEEAKGAKLELANVQIEILSPHVARETGIARVFLPESEPSETEYEAIHVKSATGWKIDRISESIPASPPPSNYERLKPLEWMIGSWVNQDDATIIQTSCRWTRNRNFIQRSFQVSEGDETEFEGTQVIGWDPTANTIRSWMFDSDGGFSVARWTNTGINQWTVRTLSVLPDGRRATSTNVYDELDENTLQFRSIGRSIDGELIPNLGPVTLARVSD